MDERKTFINWVAGMATLIVALLIVIVVMEPDGGGVSRAAASRAVALAAASQEEIKAGQPETSYFEGEAAGQWYAKYMDYLYEAGYLDAEATAATEELCPFGDYIRGAGRFRPGGRKGVGSRFFRGAFLRGREEGRSGAVQECVLGIL